MSFAMLSLLLLPALLQALVMAVDEGWYHLRRGLPRWERIGHPLDTLTTAFCYGWLITHRASEANAWPVYIVLACFSCLFIVKDEFVHALHCTAGENFLHALLFVLHPIVLLAFGWIWQSGAYPWVLQAQLLLTLIFLLYQVLFWSVFWKTTNHSPRSNPQNQALDSKPEPRGQMAERAP